eukprot:m51a1_g10401 hypothetical protein (1605) ;mRNA; f:86690-93164
MARLSKGLCPSAWPCSRWARPIGRPPALPAARVLALLNERRGDVFSDENIELLQALDITALREVARCSVQMDKAGLTPFLRLAKRLCAYSSSMGHYAAFLDAFMRIMCPRLAQKTNGEKTVQPLDVQTCLLDSIDLPPEYEDRKKYPNNSTLHYTALHLAAEGKCGAEGQFFVDKLIDAESMAATDTFERTHYAAFLDAFMRIMCPRLAQKTNGEKTVQPLDVQTCLLDSIDLPPEYEDRKKYPNNSTLHYTALHLAAEGKCGAEGQFFVDKLIDAESMAATDTFERTPLHLALRQKNTWLAENLVGKGASLTAADSTGATPLILAAAMGLTGTVSSIVQAAKSANILAAVIAARDNGGRTPLHYAVKSCQGAVALLLANGADPHVADALRRTPLHIAANESTDSANNAWTVGRALIAAKSDVNAKDTYGRTPIHYTFAKLRGMRSTAKTDPVGVLSRLCAVKGVLVDEVDKESKRSPLHYAALRGASVCSFFLMRHGAVFDRPDAQGNTPLALALYGNHQDLALCFVERGASVCGHVAVEGPPESMFRTVARRESQSIVHVLLEGGFPLAHALHDALEESKVTLALDLLERSGGPLADDASPYAALRRNYLHSLARARGGEAADPARLAEVVEKIGADRPQWSAADSDGRTPLHYAAERYNVAMASLAIRSGAPVDTADARGHTPLVLAAGIDQRAAGAGTCAMARLLLHAGASPETRFLVRRGGQKEPVEHTLLTWAARSGANDLAALLVANGADANAADSRGRTAAMHTVRQRSFTVALLTALVTAGASPDTRFVIKKTVPEKKTYAPGERPVMVVRRCEYTLLTWAVKNRVGNEWVRREVCGGEQQRVLAIPFVKLLLDKGADPNLPDSKGRTPLHHAVRLHATSAPESLAVLAELLGRQATRTDIEFAVKRRGKAPVANTLATWAVRSRDAQLLSTVLGGTARLRLDLADGKGRSPLILAVRMNDVGVAHQLLAGSDAAAVDYCDRAGRTALHHCVCPLRLGSYENVEMVAALAAAHPKCLADAEGHTPFDLARAQTDGVMVAALESHGLAESQSPVVEPEAAQPAFAEPVDWEAAAEEAVRAAEERERAAPDRTPEVDCKTIRERMEVVADEEGRPCDALLSAVDVMKGRYGVCFFYRAQLLRTLATGNVVLWTRWGRVGYDGEHQQTPFPDVASGRKAYADLLRMKLRKFRRVEISYRPRTADLLRPFNEDELRRPLGSVGAAMATVLTVTTDPRAIRSALSRSYGGESLPNVPLGRVRRETLFRARDVARKLAEEAIPAMEAAQAPADIKRALEEVVALSNEYYEAIPREDFSARAMEPIRDRRQAERELAMVERMLELQVSARVVVAAQAQCPATNPLEYCFRALDMHAEDLREDSAEFRLIDQYASVTGCGRRVHSAVRVVRRADHESRAATSRKPGKHLLLWHGSSAENYMGILLQGLRVSPAEARLTGKRFGNGIYFADMLEKAAQYGSQVFLLCDVALGAVHKVTEQSPLIDPAFDPARAGIDTTKAEGRRFPDPAGSVVLADGTIVPCGQPRDREAAGLGAAIQHDEFVAHSAAQVLIRYVVLLKCDEAARAARSLVAVERGPGAGPMEI